MNLNVNIFSPLSLYTPPHSTTWDEQEWQLTCTRNEKHHFYLYKKYIAKNISKKLNFIIDNGHCEIFISGLRWVQENSAPFQHFSLSLRKLWNNLILAVFRSNVLSANVSAN